MPEAMVGWKETVDRDDGVVPSPVPVMVDESVSPRVFVCTTSIGVAVGAVMVSLVGPVVAVDRFIVMVRPLEHRELSVAVREAASATW